MSRISKKPQEAQESKSPGLPVHSAVVDHHGKTLFGPMKQWQTSQKIPPVLLLTGQAGIGKRTMGYFLAQWIFCEKCGVVGSAAPEDSESGSLFGEVTAASVSQEKRLIPCGECISCIKALKNSWVDFTEILPEEESETRAGVLKIDQFRNLKATLGFGSHEGSYKITLIPNADRMTPQAANSLLKLLEEPPAGWIFLLTASDTTLILPTLISRCQMVKLKPFQPAELKPLLHDIKPERAELAAALSSGSWGKALALASDEVWEQRALIFNLLKNPREAMGPLIDWAVLKPAHFDVLIDQFEQLTLDLIQWSLSDLHPWVNSDAAAILTAHAKMVVRNLGGTQAARGFWLERAERFGRARVEALAPLNRKSLLQDILIPWIEITEAS